MYAMAFAANNCFFWQSNSGIARSSELHRCFINRGFKGRGISIVTRNPGSSFNGGSSSIGTDRNTQLAIAFSGNTSSTEAAKTTANPDAFQPQQNRPTYGGGWAEFANNVSGEWDGFGADFSKDGSPIELPESVVPEAYREWEVKVFDWQTQCPTLAHSSPPQLVYKVIRLLPTVGCEADAATRYSMEERSMSGAVVFAYRSDGCYVALWPGSDGMMELEHCLVDPRDKECRVRIIQVLQVTDNATKDEDDEKGLELQKIKVFCEQWYGPFRNGDQLGGCAIRDSAFASTQPLESSKVTGVWLGHNATAHFQHLVDSRRHNNVEVVDEECVSKSSRDGSGLILLPKRLWCSLDNAEDNSVSCQVGWLMDDGVAITSKCSFSAGGAHLKEIAIACETAESIQ